MVSFGSAASREPLVRADDGQMNTLMTAEAPVKFMPEASL